jgi:hypothetical protein
MKTLQHNFFSQTFGFILFVCKNGHIRIKNFWFYLHFFSCQIKMVGYDQLHIMTNHPIKYESYRTNDLRGVKYMTCDDRSTWDNILFQLVVSCDETFSEVRTHCRPLETVTNFIWIKMVGYDQLHIMTNHPIKYESYRTNDLRGVTFTKWSQTDEQMTRQTEKLYAPYYKIESNGFCCMFFLRFYKDYITFYALYLIVWGI